MILFEKDWDIYPYATIHKETKNESFLRTSYIFKQMGIKNHAFILALHNEELRHINARDEDLPLDVKQLVLDECLENPWYFFREIVHAPPIAGVMSNPLRANRANIAAYWSFFNHIAFILTQPRQTGKSFSITALSSYLMNIGCISTYINFLTANDSLRTNDLTRLKNVQGFLPRYVDMRSPGDVFNNEVAYISALNNTYKGALSNSSESLANKVGRGFTSPIFISDEPIVTPNIKIAVEAALMAGNEAREQARRNKAHYGMIFTTTAGDIDDRDAGYVYRLVSNATEFNERYYDAEDEEHLKKLVLQNSRSTGNATKRLMFYIERSYLQLGYDDEWMAARIAENLAEGVSADRDLFNRWTQGSSSSPLPKDVIATLYESVDNEPYVECYEPYNYMLRWYVGSKEELDYLTDSGAFFVIGVDTSDAVGRDDISFVVREHLSGSVVCATTFNDTNLITVADFFFSFMTRYQNSVMIIERRSSGATIMDYLIQKFASVGINPYKRLFNFIFQNRAEHEREFELLKSNYNLDTSIYDKYRKYIGFATSGSGVTSRSELYSSTLMNMCKYTGYAMKDKQTVTQIASLVIRNNRIDHPEGGNDDLVIAALLSYWLLSHGKNLNLYGLDTSKLFSKNAPLIKEKYKRTELNMDEIEEMEAKLNELSELYRVEQDDSIASKIENKILYLSKSLQIDYNKSIATEQLLEELKKERQKNLRKSVKFDFNPYV
jgi:hypothetical protein